jgi:hypothetical protein
MNLPDTQRWMFSKVVRPLTPDNHMRLADESGAELAEIDEVIAPNTKLSAFERLEVYNRQYWFRLFECLDADFPALMKLLGDKHFRKLAEAYLTEHNSTSYTLRDLGSKLEPYLRNHPEQAGKYPEAAVNIARLEWAYVEAFDGAEFSPVKPEDLAHAGEQAKLRLQPHIQFVELTCAIDEFTAEAHDYDFTKRDRRYFGKNRFKRLAETFTIAVYRMDDQISQLPLEPEAVTLLKALAAGKSLGDALEASFLGSEIPPEQIAPNVQQWFSTWSGLRWFTVAAE